MASRTPGDLGVYGFRNRVDHSYDNLVVADGSAIHAPRLWDVATRYGKPSIVVGVPGTYPPRPLNGVMVSCFLTPSRESGFTYPPLLAREVEQVVGEYLFDCTDFRTDDKDDLLRQVYQTQNTITLPVSGTGMAGMETMLANLLEPGDKMLVCAAGCGTSRP